MLQPGLAFAMPPPGGVCTLFASLSDLSVQKSGLSERMTYLYRVVLRENGVGREVPRGRILVTECGPYTGWFVESCLHMCECYREVVFAEGYFIQGLYRGVLLLL